MRGVSRAVFLFSLLLFATALHAASALGLGQSAGALYFNVSPGSNKTLNYTVFDSGPGPLSFVLFLPNLSAVEGAQTPKVVISATNGSIAAGGSEILYVTASMPGSDRPGETWNGIIQVVEVQKAEEQGGVVLHAGLGKEIIIVSSARRTGCITEYAAAAGVAAVGLLLAWLKLHSGRKRSTKDR